MSMPNVLKHSSGSALFVLLRHLTRLASKCSIFVTVTCTKMALTKKSGCAATNAKILTTWNVLHLKRKKTSNSPSSVHLMSVTLYLQAHLIGHEDDLHYKCDQCDKKCKFWEQLQ